MKTDHTLDEIERVEEWAMHGETNGSRYPGMSYEQGIIDTLNWLQGRGAAPDED
jgi:hypothetical protein